MGIWRATLKAAWQPVFQFDRSSITAFQAIRSAIGVALPLILGIVVLGQVTGGVVAASGALMLGSVGLRFPYQSRTRAMVLAFLLVTLSALVGGITGGIDWLSIPVIGIWGVVAGLFASLSQAAMIVGLESCIALIVYTHLKLDPPHALLIAGLVGLGALWQTSLTIIPSPWKNTVPERSALATIYQKLADYAAHPGDEKGVLQVSDALLAGHTTLMDSNTRSAKGQMFARLLDEAERLRLTLSLLIRQKQHLPSGEKEGEDAQIGAYLNRIIRLSGYELQVIAQALKPSLLFVGPDRASIESHASRHYTEIKSTLADLRCVVRAGDNRDEMQQILQHCTTLLGELTIIHKLATSWRDTRQPWLPRGRFPYPRPPHLHLEDTWSNLRANITPQSSAFRHAVRLGVTLALAMALYQFLQLPGGRGYWIPMTAVLVLRSDFVTTFTRGVARLLGTLLGAVLATLLAVLLAPSPSLLLLIFVLAVYCMYSLLFANYTIFSIAATVAVVFLLAFTEAPTLATAAERAVDTVIGGALALLIYALWPTWEKSQLPETIAQRIETLGGYLHSIMHVYADPAYAQGVLSNQHRASRLARSNALGSLQRAQQEPKTRRADLDLAEDMLGAADTIARAVLSLEAYLLDNPQHDTLPEIADFSQSIEQTMHQLAEAIREKQQAQALPDLQTAFQHLQAAARTKKRSQQDTRVQWQLVVEEAKQIVATLRDMQQLFVTDSFA